MQTQFSRRSIAYTLKKFWGRQRVAKLFSFALLLANLTMYGVNTIAKKQVIKNTVSQQTRIYNAFLTTVEKYKVGKTTQLEKASPYWSALRVLRLQYPQYRLVILSSDSEAAKLEEKVVSRLRNKPKGHNFTDEVDGWTRTFYLLPTREFAALQVVTYTRDDLSAWGEAAALIGAYAFVLLLAFGWFWTRSLTSNSSEHSEQPTRNQIAAVKAVLDEMAVMIERVRSDLMRIAASGSVPDFSITFDQIRALVINGSIEAARNVDAYRVFHVILNEINLLALRARDQVQGGGHSNAKQLAELDACLRGLGDLLIQQSSGLKDDEPDSSVGSEARRVG